MVGFAQDWLQVFVLVLRDAACGAISLMDQLSAHFRHVDLLYFLGHSLDDHWLLHVDLNVCIFLLVYEWLGLRLRVLGHLRLLCLMLGWGVVGELLDGPSLDYLLHSLGEVIN